MKIVLDTNVVLRFILRDHETMSVAAYELFTKAGAGEIQLLLDSVVIAECCFVLSGKVYSFSKSDIAAVLSKIVMLDGVVVDEVSRINDALETFSKYGVDYGDAYLTAVARAENLMVATFDQDFRRIGATVYPL